MESYKPDTERKIEVPIGLAWYQEKYNDNPELFAQNIALGLLTAIKRHEETFTLEKAFQPTHHGQPLRDFIYETVEGIVTDENRPAGFTSLFHSFERTAGYRSPELLTERLNQFLSELKWFDDSYSKMSYDELLGFQHRDSWVDTIYLLQYVCERRLDENFRQSGMTYYGASMDDWDQPTLERLLRPLIMEPVHGDLSGLSTRRGFSSEIYQDLIREAHHRFRRSDVTKKELAASRL